MDEMLHKKRIFQIAKELDISHLEIIQFLKNNGTEVESHMVPVTPEIYDAILLEFSKDKRQLEESRREESRKIVVDKIQPNQPKEVVKISETVPKIDPEKVQIGKIKWFGGTNSHTGKDNDYGFIESTDGEDLYINRRNVVGSTDLREDDIVIFEINNKGNRSFATHLQKISSSIKSLMIYVDIYKNNKDDLDKSIQDLGFFLDLQLKRMFTNEEILKTISEEDFIDVIDTCISTDSNKFEIYDGYFKVNIDSTQSNILESFANIIEEIDIKTLLVSENIERYITINKIKERIDNVIDEGFGKLSSWDAKKYGKILIDHNLLPLEKMIYNITFIQEAFSNIEDNKEFIDTIKNEISKGNGAKFASVIKEGNNWVELFDYFFENYTIEELITEKIDLEFIPTNKLNEGSESLCDFITSFTGDIAEFIDKNSQYLSPIVILKCLIDEIPLNEDILSEKKSAIIENIVSIIREQGQEIEEETSIETIDGVNYTNDSDEVNKKFPSLVVDELFNKTELNEQLAGLVAPIHFKKLLFEKNIDFVNCYNSNPSLSESIEYFILVEFFSTIIGNDNLDIAYQRIEFILWDALLNKKIDIFDTSLFNLFPTCTVMDSGRYGGSMLSCEAFYWKSKKQDSYETFLCRGSGHNSPSILPDLTKHYLDYNIYDWFSHFGINYISENQPAKKDFPIKIAGFFNRLKEIYERLICRECGLICMPKMEYARTSYKELDLENMTYVVKPTSARYKVTVFKCVNEDCSKQDDTFYINHCIGFSCYNYIDSRDLKIRCELSSLYICDQCGSCCDQCSKNFPNGFCPNCGSNLNIFEKNGERFVYCSKKKNTNCDFKIRTKDLPKRFTTTENLIIKKLNGESNRSSRSYSNTPFSDDDIPF